MISVKDIIWLAGLLEGEGCFGLSGDVARVTVAMTDRDVIDRVALLFGSNVRVSQPKHIRKDGTLAKVVYTTAVYGCRGAAWMMTLYSLMGDRRQKTIETSLLSWKAKKAKNEKGKGRRNPRYPCERVK